MFRERQKNMKKSSNLFLTCILRRPLMFDEISKFHFKLLSSFKKKFWDFVIFLELPQKNWSLLSHLFHFFGDSFSKYMNINPTQILSFSGSSCERTRNWKGRCQISFVHCRYRQYYWTGCLGIYCRQTLGQSPVFVQYFLSHLWVM